MSDHQISILLVEDNPGDARLLRENFREAKNISVRILHVESLQKALYVLSDKRFDVIFLDLSLPDCHGFATFSCIQEHAQDIPIILLTGNDDETLAVKAMKQGAQDYLIKGKVDSDLLVRSMRYAIERQGLLAEMEKARELEQHLAYHDVLTNLPNRLLFYDRLHQALAHAKRYPGLLAVLFLDLDGFKEINDSKGHSIGDRLLQLVANRLTNSIRESDTIARLGGDEFTILLKGIKSAEDVAKVARKVLKELSTPFSVDNHNLFVTCSIGVSVFPYDGSDAESLIKKADFAMYRAKGQSKNNYQLFNVSMDANAFERMSIEKSLRNAVINNDLKVHFQPQVCLQTGRITGIEALVRWQRNGQQLIAPSDFIPIAEETGLIVPIGEWVLRSACMQNKAWQVAGYEPMPVAINLSARQFREISLTATIAGILDETGLSPEYLVLEITETNAMQDVDYTISTLEVLKEMGVQIALDDFGTGYSSLSYLKRLPIDLLKIDKSFVNDVPENPNDASIITAIVALTHSLGMKVIAEGVETRKQLEFLKSIDCEKMQGFYFSRPLPPESFLELLDFEKSLSDVKVEARKVEVV